MSIAQNATVCTRTAGKDRLRHRAICVLGGALAVSGTVLALMGYHQVGALVAGAGALVLLTIPHTGAR